MVVDKRAGRRWRPAERRPRRVFPDAGRPPDRLRLHGMHHPSPTGSGPPVYRYYAWSAARPLRPAWLFAGSGVTPSVPIPGIVGYELDQQAGGSSRVMRVGGGSAPCQSGVTAEPGPPGPGRGGATADTTLRRLRSGALVFTTGTMGWELGLSPVPSASPDAPPAPDPRVVRMTRNLLEHVLRRR